MSIQGCVVVDENGHRQLLDARECVSVETDLFMLQTNVKVAGAVCNSVSHKTEREAVVCHDLLAAVLHLGDELNTSVH